jgi:beta-glucosidase
MIDFLFCGAVKLFVDEKEVKSFRSNNGAKKNSYRMMVEKGKEYQIRIDFQYLMGDAQLNFDLGFRMPVDFAYSIDKVKDADVVIFAGGISPALEGEEMGVNLPGFKGGDRTDIELPAVQRELLSALHQAGKKVIFLNCSGSPIGLTEEVKNCEAIVQVWYAGQAGGRAIADVLSGKYNPSGKLPVTFYKNVNQLPGFEDYRMQGRTYRYMTQEPLFPFGYGLSYTDFVFGKPVLKKKSGKEGLKYTLWVPVKNTGKSDGEEVVQVYLKKPDDKSGPGLTLRAIQKVMIPSGKTVQVAVNLTEKDLNWWNEATNQIQKTPGKYQLLVGSSSSVNDLQPVSFRIR